MPKRSDFNSGGLRPKPDSVPYDTDYRFPDDSKNTIRIWQEAPEGYPFIFREFVRISGTSHRQSSVIRFVIGRERRIRLNWEKAGPSFGLAVYGSWSEKKGLLIRRVREREELLGYVPADLLDEIGDRDIEATLACLYIPTKDTPNPGVRINLWEREKTVSRRNP